MKRIAVIAVAFVAATLIVVAVFAASPVTTSKSITFKWSPDPADLGGMTTNDYYTNIVFNLLSVTNCAIPTNQWPVVATFLASSFPSPDGVNWSNNFTIDGFTRFYLIQAANLNGGSGPFSSVFAWVPSPHAGTQPKVFGP